eukprot:6853092-Alexandrium_andersonii.AAC.1
MFRNSFRDERPEDCDEALNDEAQSLTRLAKSTHASAGLQSFPSSSTEAPLSQRGNAEPGA